MFMFGKNKSMFFSVNYLNLILCACIKSHNLANIDLINNQSVTQKSDDQDMKETIKGSKIDHSIDSVEYIPVPRGSVPQCANQLMTICTQVENYPKEVVTKLFHFDGKKADKIMDGTVKATINDESSNFPEPPENMIPIVNNQSNRVNSAISFNSTNNSAKIFKRHTNNLEKICKSQTIYITPKVALNDKSEWKFIINIDNDNGQFRQIIRVDVCTDANGPCSSIVSFPFGFHNKCRQKYMKKQLLALDSTGLTASSENFFIPSCCVCEIVKEYQ